MLNRLLSRSKRKRLGYWIYVDFSEEAKQNSVGNDFLKKIYHMKEGYMIGSENYSRAKIAQLRRRGLYVKDFTIGKEVPKESTFVPVTQEIAGILQLTRRV